MGQFQRIPAVLVISGIALMATKITDICILTYPAILKGRALPLCPNC